MFGWVDFDMFQEPIQLSTYGLSLVKLDPPFMYLKPIQFDFKWVGLVLGPLLKYHLLGNSKIK